MATWVNEDIEGVRSSQTDSSRLMYAPGYSGGARSASIGSIEPIFIDERAISLETTPETTPEPTPEPTKTIPTKKITKNLTPYAIGIGLIVVFVIAIKAFKK